VSLTYFLRSDGWRAPRTVCWSFGQVSFSSSDRNFLIFDFEKQGLSSMLWSQLGRLTGLDFYFKTLPSLPHE